MIQAARSGKQNILEGSKASGTSKEMENQTERIPPEPALKSFSTTTMISFDQDSNGCGKKTAGRPCLFDGLRRSRIRITAISAISAKRAPAEIVANIAICLIHQTNDLLDQQIRRLERDFINEGGIRERMAHIRQQRRRRVPPALTHSLMSPISPIRCATQRSLPSLQPASSHLRS